MALWPWLSIQQMLTLGPETMLLANVEPSSISILSWVPYIFQLRELAPCTKHWFVRITLLEGKRKLLSICRPTMMVQKLRKHLKMLHF